MGPDSPPDVTRLLQAWSDGDSAALDQLFAAVYRDLHRQAERYMRAQSSGHTGSDLGFAAGEFPVPAAAGAGTSEGPIATPDSS